MRLQSLIRWWNLPLDDMSIEYPSSVLQFNNKSGEDVWIETVTSPSELISQLPLHLFNTLLINILVDETT